MYQIIDFFTDPILQASTIGSMLMCMAASLVGVIVLIRKKSLLGEVLSHAAYPGLVLGAWFFSLFLDLDEEHFPLFLFFGAFIFSWLALSFLKVIQKKFRVKNDAALCFTLASFFGVGVLLASRLQYVEPIWYKQIQVFLYGQAATLMNVHVWLYAILSLVVLFLILIFYRAIQIANFDPDFAFTVGLPIKVVEHVFFILLVLAVVVAIRSIGVVLFSGMLIAPALAARQMTHQLWKMFFISSLISIFSAFFGNYFSLMIPLWLFKADLILPTGPMILLCSFVCTILSLLFSPKKGLLLRFWRKYRFSQCCEEENILKFLWKGDTTIGKSLVDISFYRQRSAISTWILLIRQIQSGWVVFKKGKYVLSQDGVVKAERLVRLHRLWEVYLVHLGQNREKVHASAEQMEHVITPELEHRLSNYLNDPQFDPHHQPIPKPREIL